MANHHQVEMSHGRLQQEDAALTNRLGRSRSRPLVISAHGLGIEVVGFALCEVGPGPVALRMTSPLSRFCAHFRRHRWKHEKVVKSWSGERRTSHLAYFSQADKLRYF